jgi:hypothetical protein
MINPQLRALRLEILRDKGLRERWEERAGIMQYDGGLTREQSEESAIVEVLNDRSRTMGRLRPASQRH